MRVPGKRGPRSGPDGATREALLEAAFKEFTYHGFDRATTRQIAKAANVDPAMVNYRFGSKEDLWLAVLENIKTQSIPYIREARELIQDPDPERSIKALMQVILRVGVEKPMISMMIFNESTTPRADIIRRTTKDGVHLIDGVPVAQSVFGQDPFEPVRHSRVAEILGEQTAVPVVQRAMRAGCFPEGDPSLALFMLIAGVSQAVSNYGGDSRELRAKAAHLLDNLTNRRP